MGCFYFPLQYFLSAFLGLRVTRSTCGAVTQVAQSPQYGNNFLLVCEIQNYSMAALDYTFYALLLISFPKSILSFHLLLLW